MIQTKPTIDRSLKQNAYYHKIIVKQIADHKKWTPSRTHGWIKDTWGIGSTATLTTGEFVDLIENIRGHCLFHWELYIPLPEYHYS